jgi:RNA polymerase sigma factor (sigma-70 family)
VCLPTSAWNASRLPLSRFQTTLAEARTGDEAAWTEIYRSLAPGLLGYLRGQGAVEPEDLLGEVMLQLVRDLPRFAGDERQFRAFAFTVAHHRLIDDRRRRGRRPVEPVPDELLVPSGVATDAEREALERLGAERLRALIGRLSPAQRNVLLLRIFGGLTVVEVARAIGKRPGAVKALQRRALAAVARELSKEGVPL